MKKTRTIVRGAELRGWGHGAAEATPRAGFAHAFRAAGRGFDGRSAPCRGMTPGLLIVGGGLAAQRCCETLRALGHDGPVTVVGPERPYDRPPLSKDMPAEPPWLRPLDWYAAHDVALRTGVAERLDATRRIVVLAGGERIRYDDLLIATGSEPVRLPALGGLLERAGAADARRTRCGCARRWRRARG